MANNNNNNNDKLKAKLGARLRELRKGRKMTQEKLSHACSLDRSYVASIEQGRRNVSYINLHKLSKALGITLSEYFNGF